MPLAAILIATAHTADGDPVALLLCGDGRTLVEWQIEQLRLAGVRDVEVVLDAASDAVIPLISRDNVEPVIDPLGGSAPALRAGAAAVPRGTATALLSFIEHPRHAETLRRLIDAHADGGAAIARPSHRGAPGMPLALREDALAWLRNITDARGVDALLERWRDAIADVPFDADEILREVNSAEDVARGVW